MIRFAVEIARALAGGGIDIEPESGCDIDLVAHGGEPAADFQTVFNPLRWRFRWVLPKQTPTVCQPGDTAHAVKSGEASDSLNLLRNFRELIPPRVGSESPLQH